MRAGVYCRISNDAQGKAAGVRRQEEECRALAEREGLEVVEVFTDNDVKASARKRPAFDALQTAIREGRVDVVVAWHDDRLLRGGRSKRASDYLQLVMERRTSHRFVTADDWDLTSASGRLMVDIRLGLSGYEVERVSERQKARWRQRKQDGKLVTLGRRPFGLRRDGERMVEVKKEADALRRAARDLVEGRSLYAVTREMPPPVYGKRWNPQHLRRALMGDHLVRYGVLDRSLHRLVVARLESEPKRGPGRPRREYGLTGLVVCGLCGAKMSAGSGQYSCQACGKVSSLTKYVDRLVGDLVLEHLPEEEPEPEPARDDAPVLKELAEVEDRIAALADNLDLSEQVLARRTRALEAKRDDLMSRLGQRRDVRVDWKKLWQDLERGLPVGEEARRYLGTIIERVVVNPATKPSRKGFDPERVEVVWRK